MAIKFDKNQPIMTENALIETKAPFDPSFLMHDDDRKALAALRAIPGFSAVMKAFMNVWNEKQFYIQNMSSNIRLSRSQMSRYYDMLIPVCNKLHIDVPELYITMNVVPNAYTYGDTKPFITLTTGLLDVMPEELIPAVLAHECGHIACHHVLYLTMGSLLLNGTAILGSSSVVGHLLTTPLQVAFYHWMRCSELSADRASAYCSGSTEPVVDMCMRFAGYSKNMDVSVNREEFMAQAAEYKQMISSSAWNKTLEFLILKDMTHPFNAVRAWECREWGRTRNLTR